MQSIYESAYGFYSSEPNTTLYVSHMIVFNVPYLAALHPQDSTQFYTDAFMVEHNFVEPELSEKIQKYLAGEPEQTESLDKESVRKTEETKEETAEVITSIEPATEETPVLEAAEDVAASSETVEEVPEEIAKEPSEEIVDETVEPVQEIAAETTQETVNFESEPETIAPVTEEMIECVPETAVFEQEPKIVSEEELQVTPEAEIEAHELKRTPEGDQLTMAFPTINEGNTEEESEDDGILTLDLDAFI
jgi:hypothetical protein